MPRVGLEIDVCPMSREEKSLFPPHRIILMHHKNKYARIINLGSK